MILFFIIKFVVIVRRVELAMFRFEKGARAIGAR
jgi:hypothetical protein